MIKSFAHRGLKRLFEDDNGRAFTPNIVTRLTMVLDAIEEAKLPSDLDYTGMGLQKLTGERRGTWAITITRNWRITFKMEDGDAFEVNYEDYH